MIYITWRVYYEIPIKATLHIFIVIPSGSSRNFKSLLKSAIHQHLNPNWVKMD